MHLFTDHKITKTMFFFSIGSKMFTATFMFNGMKVFNKLPKKFIFAKKRYLLCINLMTAKLQRFSFSLVLRLWNDCCHFDSNFCQVCLVDVLGKIFSLFFIIYFIYFVFPL